MFNYFFDTNQYTELLQYLSLFLLFVIGFMVYFMSKSGDKMRRDIKNEISNLDLECPKCPEHPSCPACPKCPDLKCNEGLCPECPVCSDENKECPACPTIPEVSCPSVEDIVTGIFPGRNPGITNSGNYFDIQANENYELLPDYSVYNSVESFPSDNILSAPGSLIQGNINISPDEINNTGSTLDNTMINTSQDVSLSRMNMASAGESTGASSNSQMSMETGVPDSTNTASTDNSTNSANTQMPSDP